MKNHFSENLRFLRNKNNETQEDISGIVNKERSLIGHWESGNREPTVEDIIKLSNHFHVAMHDLIEKDLRIESENNNFSELDQVLFSKAKELSDEDKKVILNVIESINKKIDEQDNR